jgi:hypothetical protein
VAGLGLERPVSAKPVERARPHACDVAVKDLVSVFGQLEPVDFRSFGPVEDADIDPGRMPRPAATRRRSGSRPSGRESAWSCRPSDGRSRPEADLRLWSVNGGNAPGTGHSLEGALQAIQIAVVTERTGVD